MKKFLVIAPYQYLPYFSGGQKLIAQFLDYLGRESDLTVISVSENDPSLIKTYKHIAWLKKKSFSKYFDLGLISKLIALIKKEKFDAVICLGTIIRGQTPHFDYISSEVTRGIGEAGLQTGVPVVYGVVTADTVDQAIDRAGVKLGNKGFEAATTAVELVNLYKTVNREK